MTDNKVPTCGDCIHADVCARVPFFTEFSRENPAYCDNFKEMQKWIPVTERLPEDDRQVLACTKKGKAFSAHYDHLWKSWCVSHTVTITHWMPLPEPPKEA